MDLRDRTVVVTGASAGIGAAAARALAALGARVVPVGRDPERTASIAAEVGARVHTADFSRLDDVRRLADDLLDGYDDLAVLANNAGGVWPDAQLTVDGHERTWQVNHLAPYLLTRLLTERVVASGGRVLTTASMIHTRGRLAPDGGSDPRPFTSSRAYGASKLANVLFARELATRNPGLPSASFHPGVVASQFAGSQGMWGRFYSSPFRRFMRTSEQGAETLVWLATQDGWPTGGYFAKSAPATASATGRDDTLACAVWTRAAKDVGLGV